MSTEWFTKTPGGDPTARDSDGSIMTISGDVKWRAKKRKRKPVKRHKNVRLECGPNGSTNSCFGIYVRPLKTRGPKAGLERRTTGEFSVLRAFVQTDWDYPGLARSLGWDIQDCQITDDEEGTVCSHQATDGTVICPDCGCTPSTFICAAYDWLHRHDGDTFECHDYEYPPVEAT